MIEKNDAEKNLVRVHEWTRAADQKISIFLAFQGVLLTLLFPMIFKSFQISHFSKSTNFYSSQNFRDLR